MSVTKLKRRLNALGYRLVRCYRSPIAMRIMPYATFPLWTGPINLFENLEQVEKYVEQVEKIRSWQEDYRDDV